MVTIYVASWEMQCCGTPFAVGDTVTWQVENWQGKPISLPGVNSVDYFYSAHATNEKVIENITGKCLQYKQSFADMSWTVRKSCRYQWKASL